MRSPAAAVCSSVIPVESGFPRCVVTVHVEQETSEWRSTVEVTMDLAGVIVRLQG